MQRVTRPSAVATMPAPPVSPSAPGFFTGGNPGGGQPATTAGYEWFNAVQEELIGAIVGAGLTPDQGTLHQLRDAIRMLAVGTMNIFTSSGTFVVPAGVRRVRATVTGGGGQGGGATGSPIRIGSGGGAGGTAVGIFSVTPGQTHLVTVGGGGYNPAAGVDGAAGSTSSFGALLSATGGQGGKVGTAPIGGNGGFGVGGAYEIFGGDGVDVVVIAGGVGNYGGVGGGTPFGTSNRSSRFGIGGQGYGVGGAGAVQGTLATGSGGSNGIVIVEY